MPTCWRFWTSVRVACDDKRSTRVGHEFLLCWTLHTRSVVRPGGPASCSQVRQGLGHRRRALEAPAGATSDLKVPPMSPLPGLCWLSRATPGALRAWLHDAAPPVLSKTNVAFLRRRDILTGNPAEVFLRTA